ncbi:Rhodanese-like protein [Dentipellis sp. KUC8613]|nr:Rhodanese-like protein [Dentipellis sp. KUC8613]
MPLSYIDPDELAQIIKSDKVPHKDYIVVDVRDDDYVGGNIKSSHNAPSSHFLVNVNQLVEKTKDVPMVIFHCALSQQRGPRAARIYSETRDNLQLAGKDTDHQILVLRGGFAQFQAKFKDDPGLVENWDPDVWAAEWTS